MTTTPNDAAVNAESVKEKLLWIAITAASGELVNIDRNSINTIAQLREAANMIERRCIVERTDDTATPQTQSTHGEGTYGGPPPELIERRAEFSRKMAEVVAKENAATHGEGEADCVWYASDVVQDDNGHTFIATVGLSPINDSVKGYLHYEEAVYQVLAVDAEECAENLRALLKALNKSTANQHTHADQCWTWGPKHYECALERIRVLEGGEGEAVALNYVDVFNGDAIAFPGDNKIYPAPSPTAAPALGELATKLAWIADNTGEPYAEDLRKASAALSGVAAQGDGGELAKLIDIPAMNGLDPITVILRDFAREHGQIIVSCYGQAWTAYWAAMGDRDIRQFLLDCETGYIVNKLGAKRHDFDYVSRIVEVIKTHLPVTAAALSPPTAARVDNKGEMK